MPDDFSNVYEDERRAEVYANLEFPGTYWLAYRDLPRIIGQHVSGRRALDFGCGAGRSTRFLQRLGFETIGVDISKHMLERARSKDPAGEYRLVPDGALPGLEEGSFDLVLSVFTFDNVPTIEKRVSLHRALLRLLKEKGRMVSLVSSTEIYRHEWTSFSTRDFPDNLKAESGDPVRIVMLDVEDRRPVRDILWSDESYRDLYDRAGFTVVDTHRPLGRPGEPFEWVTEEEISPWAIYVLKRGPE